MRGAPRGTQGNSGFSVMNGGYNENISPYTQPSQSSTHSIRLNSIYALLKQGQDTCSIEWLEALDLRSRGLGSNSLTTIVKHLGQALNSQYLWPPSSDGYLVHDPRLDEYELLTVLL